jgi:4a-hydroxytetrahydrobiopterin dehydratase
MSTLADERCVSLPSGSAPLSRQEIERLLHEVTGWDYDGQTIGKTYRFPDFYRTMAFVNAVAWIAHQEDHHPELGVEYNRCRIRFSTHSIAGISRNDFVCAAKIEALRPE